MFRHKYLAVFVVYSAVCLQVINSQNECTAQTCGKCISQTRTCAWCTQADVASRCGLAKDLMSGGCNASNIVDPQSSLVLIKNEQVRDERQGDDSAILLQPQHVSLTLRPNSPEVVKVTYRQAKNYPVDMYFLMDISKSMDDDREKVSTLATLISTELLKLTNNVRFGLGSFVDKAISPFMEYDQNAYSFKHHLSLTAELSQFKDKLDGLGETGGYSNRDYPEGGLDAMMQVSVCENRIGWRKAARRVIIYSSDELFKSAGDGKLAGIVLPNDGRCHLDATDEYPETFSLKYDYPSVYHIARMVEDNNINVIFAVNEKYSDIYEKLSEVMDGSKVGALRNDSSNIVDLLRDNYAKIAATVDLTAKYDTDYVKVDFHSKCLEGPVRDTNKCTGIHVEQSVEFDVVVEVIKCPPTEAGHTQTVTVTPVGLRDTLNITLNIMCGCGCEQANNTIPNSDQCSNGNGTLTCGICACNEGRYGQTCQCGGEQLISGDLETQCIDASSANKLVCSGVGDCVCGVCQCRARTPESPSEVYSGKYCQCDDYSCDLHDDLICGGDSRGRCICGKCKCHTEYEGDACGCDLSKEACLDDEGAECNGNGQCVCGKCQCNEEKRCYGSHCQKCPECIGNCACNRDCVECTVFDSGELKEKCMEECSATNITSTDTLPDVNGTTCQEKFADDSGCSYKFIYRYSRDNHVHITALRTKVCPEPVEILPIALGVTGGVLGIGLLFLIIWKLVTSIYDKREYQKFEQETREPQFASEGNPLFRPARSHFQNPTWQTAQ